MKLLRYRDEGRVKVALVGRSAHVFLYQHGMTVRWRRRHGSDWRHVTVKAEAARFARTARTDATGRLNLRVETWVTSDGTTARIRFSKKYVLLKILV